MQKRHNNIPKFLSEKRSIWLFLLSVLFFAILFILVYKPAGFMRTSELLSPWNKYIYTAIQVFSGFIILLVSRISLAHFLQRHETDFSGIALWIALEMIVITLVLSVIASLLNAAEGLDFVELLWRVAVNIISILFIPYVITVLIFMLQDRRHQIDTLSKRIENMSGGNDMSNDNMNFYDRGGKLVFSTRRSNVLYIEAADNYSNIHYINEGKEETFILHNSMKHLDISDNYPNLLRCHKSYMVNIDNVKLLRKEKEGLLLELAQGARSIPVSRTYNEKVVHFFASVPES